jgi:hypothetical protein
VIVLLNLISLIHIDKTSVKENELGQNLEEHKKGILEYHQ